MNNKEKRLYFRTIVGTRRKLIDLNVLMFKGEISNEDYFNAMNEHLKRLEGNKSINEGKVKEVLEESTNQAFERYIEEAGKLLH